MTDESIYSQPLVQGPGFALSDFGTKRLYALENARRRHDASTADMIDQLVAHDHARTRDILRHLKRLIGMAKETVSRPSGWLAEIEERLEILRRGLEENMASEERNVFDLIRALEREDDLRVFQADIDRAVETVSAAQGRITAQIRDLLEVSEELAIEYGECGASVAIHQNLCDLASDLEIHFRTESDVLFPRTADREPEMTARG